MDSKLLIVGRRAGERLRTRCGNLYWGETHLIEFITQILISRMAYVNAQTLFTHFRCLVDVSRLYLPETLYRVLSLLIIAWGGTCYSLDGWLVKRGQSGRKVVFVEG
ncbi:hypothetical protein [Enterobacter sp. KBR-315C3_2022]|uniref:hypothetical protein n=1 Tax=Enterobacter sp. KBR-315C3_2022 TaxID=3242494 RepID=UPI003528D4C8